ncbi:hypothetical protein [Kutzneria sp. CA-103260]|nr:hypothetical protein [Kutzneria sp. CA-103260]
MVRPPGARLRGWPWASVLLAVATRGAAWTVAALAPAVVKTDA